MVLPIEERRRIARENGSKSKGPLTYETKMKCSQNARKDSLFARTHLLDEDPAEVARLRARYFATPARTPEEEFLRMECFQGHLMAVRFHRARSDLLNRQQALNLERWDEERTGAVQTMRAQLVSPEAVDIYPIVCALKGFGHGLMHLSEEWLRLRRALLERGFLCPEESHMGLRMLGVLPNAAAISQHEDGFLFALWSFAAHPIGPVGAIESMLRPENRPAGLRDVPAEELLPDRATCRDQLIRWIDDELADLAAAEERVWIEVDGPSRARVLSPAALELDEEQARRFHRAAGLYRSTFYKAHYALEDLHKRAAAKAEEHPYTSAGPAEADIKPPARGGASDPEPDGAPGAATEVVAEDDVECRAGQEKAGIQNEPRIGPDGPLGDRPEGRRSYHKSVAKKSVVTIVRDRSHGPRRE